MMGLLDNKHASGCDGKEFTKVATAPYGHGFAVVKTVWCGDCGAADWDVVDFVQPDPEEVARR
jgi:hypothetical protein